MNTTHTAFVGSIPEIYDRDLAPLLFEHFADDLAGRIDIGPDGRVLETACGTGILTSALRARLPAAVAIQATDLNPPMLDHARAVRGGLAGVEFSEANAQDLPFPDSGFDAVVCQFGLMFFPDQPLALGEALRVLKPGGRFLTNTWGALAENPIVALAGEVIAGFFDGDPPTFLATPFGLSDRAALGDLLGDAGFTEVEVVDVGHLSTPESAAAIARGLVCGNPGVLEINDRARAPATEVTAALADAIRREFGDGPVRAPLMSILASGRRPA